MDFGRWGCILATASQVRALFFPLHRASPEPSFSHRRLQFFSKINTPGDNTCLLPCCTLHQGGGWMAGCISNYISPDAGRQCGRWCLRAATSSTAFAPRYLTRTAQSHFNNPKRILVCFRIKIINSVGASLAHRLHGTSVCGFLLFGMCFLSLALSCHREKRHKSCLQPLFLLLYGIFW